MQDSVLQKQWQFLLMSQMRRGVWALEAEKVIAMGATVQELMNRDWNSGMQTLDLEEEKTRAEFPVAAITKTGQVFAGKNSLDQAPEGSTAVIPLKGTMLKYGTYCTYGTEEIASKLLEAAMHRNISSLVLDVDSGGGAVDAVAPMVQAIAKTRNIIGKPVVASADLAASAAYWAVAACNQVIANNQISAEFGSIGVMMSFWDVIPYWEKEGFKFHKVYATQSDWKNKTFELALQGKYDEIKAEELDPLAIAFQNAIKANRGNQLKMDVPGLLNGRMFFANNEKDNSLNAKEVGLINEIGTLDDAIDLSRDLAKSAFVDKYVQS
jgi:protease-4